MAIVPTSSHGSAVSTVFGRVGDIVAAAGDYLASQVTNAADKASAAAQAFAGAITSTGDISARVGTGNICRLGDPEGIGYPHLTIDDLFFGRRAADRAFLGNNGATAGVRYSVESVYAANPANPAAGQADIFVLDDGGGTIVLRCRYNKGGVIHQGDVALV